MNELYWFVPSKDHKCSIADQRIILTRCKPLRLSADAIRILREADYEFKEDFCPICKAEGKQITLTKWQAIVHFKEHFNIHPLGEPSDIPLMIDNTEILSKTCPHCSNVVKGSEKDYEAHINYCSGNFVWIKQHQRQQ